ncbi:MAG: MFS transporter, partial [Candidatus Limnocylindrales bacterium]
MLRLAVALFAVQAGFHGFTAALPVALARAGMPDPQIGLIVGTAALIQVPAAFVGGVVIDRIGGLRVFIGGGVAYLVGCAILLLPGVEPGGSVVPFLASRLFQGIGAAAMLPSAMSLVPRLSDPARRGFALAFMGSAHNLTLVV